MVVMSSLSPIRSKKTRAFGIPLVDLSLDTSTCSNHIVKACEEYGFFKVVNHGIPMEVISRMENQGLDFFSKPASHKHKAKATATAKANAVAPFGYGCKNIGFNGDMGELEYLLLQTNPLFRPSGAFDAISDHPTNFSCAVDDYIQAVKELTCELLDLLAKGLCLPDTRVFSSLITHVHTDSCFRVNHYPPTPTPTTLLDHPHQHARIGFGEHSDPQILTVMRSNDVPGLQISTPTGLWIPVTPQPNEFCVFVGDALEVLANGRFSSVRHRVMANSSVRSRMSIMYFGAPSLDAWISPIPQMISPDNPRQYKAFTWSQYKKAAYSLRLGDRRIDLFKSHPPPC